MKSALYSALFALLITNIICQDDSSYKELQELSLAMKSCTEADARLSLLSGKSKRS